MKFSLFILTAFLFLLAMPGQTQHLEQQQVTANYTNKPLADVLRELEQTHQFRVFYLTEWVDSVKVTQQFEKVPLLQALQTMLSKVQLGYVLYDNHNVILVPQGIANKLNTDTTQPENAPVLADRERLVTISGVVRNAKSNDVFIGATVLLAGTNKATITDDRGYYVFTVPAGNYTLVVKAVGMMEDKRELKLNGSRTVNIALFEATNQLRQVEVTTRVADENVSSLEIGVTRINIQDMKKMPAFLGEVDVVQSVLALPGVSTVGEGATGFNVRGGSIDQNLVLQDQAPLFNSSHLFGFFSVFNPDMVKDVTLYRGGTPAAYGGRVSSVLDVKLKDGNYKAPIVSGGVGLLSSRLTIEGPIVKDKASAIISARAAYPGWLLGAVPDMTVRKSNGYFYDLNAKATYKLSPADQLSFSGYLSHDGFRFGADTTYTWGTRTGSLAWNHTFNDRLSSELTAITGNYRYGVSSETMPYDYSLDSEIDYNILKADLKYELSEKHAFGFGTAATHYHFNSGQLKPASEESALTEIRMPKEKAVEGALYLDHAYTLNSRLSLSYGLRFSTYYHLGPGDVYVYDPTMPRREATITDTLQYGNNKVIEQYNYLEPRASIRFNINESSSIKLGYNRMVQYIHLISNTTAASPVDIWKPSNPYLKPQIGDQLALGYFKNFKENTIELSVETYYKKLHNLVEYKDGARLLLNNTLDADLLPGDGKAYGIELMLRRQGKLLNGWASYTYSRSLRKVTGAFPSETINNGSFYPSNFDKPHDFTLVLNQQLTRLLSFSTNFTYSTGRPITYPESVSKIDGLLVVNYSDRNQYRIPDYHRLDVSLILDGTNKRNARWQSSWIFSVYNVYGRQNPYSVYFKPTYGGTIPQAYKLSVIGSAVPSVTYNFKFTK